MRRISAPVIALWFASISLAAGVVIFVSVRFETLESERQALERERDEWIDTADRLTKDLDATKAELAETDKQLEVLKQPQTVTGPAQFPISRVLARENDTVERLARREKTTSEVVFALNPWLGGTNALVAGQAIWIPTP